MQVGSSAMHSSIERDYFKWVLRLSHDSDENCLRAQREVIQTTPEDFEEERHQNLQRLMRELVDNGIQISALSVQSAVPPDKWHLYGGDAYLADLILPALAEDDGSYAPAARKIENLALHIRKTASEGRRADLIGRAHSAAEGRDFEGARRLFEQSEWLEMRDADEFMDWRSFAEAQLTECLEAEEANDAAEPLRFPFGALDAQFGPIAPGSMTIVGARPSVGKSALMGVTMLAGWARNGRRIGYISCEDPISVLQKRVLSHLTGIPARTLQHGHALSTAQKAKIDEVYRDDALRLIKVRDCVGAPLQTVLEAMHSLVRRGRVEAIVIDYAQVVRVPRARDPRERVRTVAEETKATASRLGVPLVLLSQLSRRKEVAEDARPKLDQLRDAGDLEEMAEAVLMLWQDKSGTRRMWVAKNKTGRRGDVLTLEWSESTASIVDITQPESEFND